MRYLFTILGAFFITVSTSAKCSTTPTDYTFYIKASSGFSCSESANVSAPSPLWNRAIQGYNASMGTCPIIGLSVGAEFLHLVDFELSLSNRSTYEYKKLQTPVDGGDSYTRRFDLDVTPILLNVQLLGASIESLHLNTRYGKIYPTIGFGIGVSRLLITNFRTTDLPSTGDSFPYPSFSAENQYTLRTNFTYMVLAGVEYNHQDRWAINLGYRLLNSGYFSGPQYLRVSSGSSVDVGKNQWKMRYVANELCIELKLFI